MDCIMVIFFGAVFLTKIYKLKIYESFTAATDDRIMFKVALDNRGGMKILENEYKILARLKEIPSDVGNLGCLRVYKFHSKAIIRTKKKMMSRFVY